jgi:hypothetical protein
VLVNQDHLPHDCGLAARFADVAIFGLSTGNKFHLDITAGIPIAAERAGRRVQTGGDLENLESNDSSSTGTEPSISSRRHSIRAPSVAERQAAPQGGILAFTGGNDDRSRSKYGRLLIGWFLVFSQSWETAVETRNALTAPGRPGSRPTPKLSI